MHPLLHPVINVFMFTKSLLASTVEMGLVWFEFFCFVRRARGGCLEFAHTRKLVNTLCEECIVYIRSVFSLYESECRLGRRFGLINSTKYRFTVVAGFIIIQNSKGAKLWCGGFY